MTTDGRAPDAAQAAQDSAIHDNWQQPSLDGLLALEVEAMPAFEVLLLDDLAAYLMGSGPVPPPYTVEHGSRIVSALLGAIVNSAHYQPQDCPAVTDSIALAREHVVQGAHQFAALGIAGLNQLTSRLIPAALGELELRKDAPEQQTCSLFYYALLAVASGPANVMNPAAADGVAHTYRAWDEVFGRGFMPPWRRTPPLVVG
jgi:hypothetical protein